MVKEIRFKQKNPKVGDVNGIIRIVGKELFLKVNSYTYARQLLDKFKQAGCLVEEGSTWIKIDMFHTNKNVILGGIEFNSDEETAEELEDKLYKFYMIQYAKAGMKVKGRDL